MLKNRSTHSKGFTLVELMIVVVIVAIFAAIAIPSYQEYVRRAIAAQAQQEMQRLSTELERGKTRNFNYLGFQTTPNPIVLPVGATGAAIQYTITVSDGIDVSKSLTDSTASGQSWVMRGMWKAADTTNVDNFSFLMTSSGVRCKNKTKANITATNVGNATCGVGREEW
ncbi:prepilin-type N-terminal cleavage/methylation domain-containing protein [Acinetobacter halotolerans]|uniref:Prepilin-type N-terminal cleavage/methylation domain-containing protein n=1 Tax=Acinetobacter halotolerans TaxID=1752076 RepID=A0A4Q6XNE0_9GAMM|nr:prepilin-type N-terminal cleavage/methylation domain-containing protein [Acinetobacter halotolerans]RZF56934.1 prepilin-type N-terminal cleavage/methylation domain-containing protein [Acinetobacter halotolerans]